MQFVFHETIQLADMNILTRLLFVTILFRFVHFFIFFFYFAWTSFAKQIVCVMQTLTLSLYLLSLPMGGRRISCDPFLQMYKCTTCTPLPPTLVQWTLHVHIHLLNRRRRIELEFNRLFQKDRGKTASAARILSPNPTRRPLPCLLIQSFFYDSLVQYPNQI